VNYNKRAIPADFAEQAGLLSANGLSLHYHAARKVISRWLATLPADAPRFILVRPVQPRKLPRPMPVGFAEVAAVTTAPALADIYGVCASSVQVWIRALPEDARAARRLTMERKLAVRRSAGAVRRGRGPSMLAKFDNENQRTRVDLAAMHLQRRFVPVVRASIYGQQFAGLWQVGRLKMPETDMIALAVKQGWAL
jgi:hypothetical protein